MPRIGKSTAFCAALFALVFVANLSAQTVPTGFNVDTLVSAGLNAPHDFAFLPDGRVLIAERAGTIKLWRPGTSTVSAVGSVPSTQVGSERGLLSIAVRGDALYCWASRSTTSNMVLSRFTLQGSLNAPTSTSLFFLPTSEYVVINNAPDTAFNHNGGTIRFGPDEMLYLSIGDDANCNNALVYNSLAGVLVRLDLSGLPAGAGGPPSIASLAPADNPFAGGANDNRKLGISKGLRNPYSFNLDPVTGDIYIADVGQNAREELNLWRRTMGSPLVAKDFGWPYREGDISYGGCGGIGSTPAGLKEPIDVRTSGSGSRSIVAAGIVRNFGGAFDFGPAYEAHVFHSDYFNGSIERIFQPTGLPWTNAASVPGQPSATYWGTGFTAASHFDQGPDGAIYFVQHSGTYGNSGGTFKRIRGGGPVYNLNVTGGDGQVCTSGETFGAPLTVRVTDMGAAPVAGIEVNLTTENGSAAFGTAGPYVTNANGEISVIVSSTGVGAGDVLVQAFAIGAAPIDADLFARKLEITYIPGAGTDQMIVDFHNRSNAVNPFLPFLFVVSDVGEPIFPTIYGPLYVNLVTLNNTVIIEDSTGGFGNINLGPTLPFGVPGFTANYFLASGAYAGTTNRFQAFVYDASILVSQAGAGATNTGLTNPVTFTFQ
ncbi:MAG: glucose/arabinose dehydrogenase [Planctomycetota bacterium]|jgi:glucose/arabinose dehydrogenase